MIFHHVCDMLLPCPGHKIYCCHKKMSGCMSFEGGILLLPDDSPTQASGYYSGFGFIIIWDQWILPFSTSKSEVLCSPLVSSLLLFNGMDFLYPSKLLWKHKCIATDVTSVDILLSGLLLQVYLTLSCLRQKSFFTVLPLSLLSLTSKQLFPSWILLKSVFTFIHHWFPTLI